MPALQVLCFYDVRVWAPSLNVGIFLCLLVHMHKIRIPFVFLSFFFSFIHLFVHAVLIKKHYCQPLFWVLGVPGGSQGVSSLKESRSCWWSGPSAYLTGEGCVGGEVAVGPSQEVKFEFGPKDWKGCRKMELCFPSSVTAWRVIS